MRLVERQPSHSQSGYTGNPPFRNLVVEVRGKREDNSAQLPLRNHGLIDLRCVESQTLRNSEQLEGRHVDSTYSPHEGSGRPLLRSVFEDVVLTEQPSELVRYCGQRAHLDHSALRMPAWYTRSRMQV